MKAAKKYWTAMTQLTEGEEKYAPTVKAAAQHNSCSKFSFV